MSVSIAPSLFSCSVQLLTDTRTLADVFSLLANSGSMSVFTWKTDGNADCMRRYVLRNCVLGKRLSASSNLASLAFLISSVFTFLARACLPARSSRR